jgi:hypothetical protein
LRTTRLRRPSPSLVISVIALFVALGGTGYAATTLAKNSVGSKQLKKKAVTNSKLASNAVTGSKVKNNSLTGADVFESSLGKVPSAASADAAAHATNADTAANATHATTADKVPFPTVLPTGQTVTGTFAMRGPNGTAASAITFPVPLAAAPTVHIILIGQPAPAGCSGDSSNPGADSGNVCIFEGFNFNANALQTCNPNGGGSCMSNTSTRFGTGVIASAAASSLWDEFGTWAATG